MKLIYITNNRLPTLKAHGVQIAKMGEAFSKNRIAFELLYPQRKNFIKEDFFDFYGLKTRFKMTKIWSWDLVGVVPKLGFRLQSLTFAWGVLFYLIKKKYKGVIYSRDPFSALFLSFNKNWKVVFEVHFLPDKIKFYNKFLFKRVYKIIAISQGLKKDLISIGISENKILIAPDGVDLSDFDKVKESKEELRKKLGLPQGKKIIMYTGHLYKWKGVYVLAQAGGLLKKGSVVVFVGGTSKDIQKFKKFIKKKNIKNIILAGYQKTKLIPYYLKSADILVLPNSGNKKISFHYTSPLKLFEYMASGRPVVASSLPSIKEILNENNAIFFKPDNIQDLAQKINLALQNSDLSVNISKQAFFKVKKFTWEKRAQKIIKFINQ